MYLVTHTQPDKVAVQRILYPLRDWPNSWAVSMKLTRNKWGDISIEGTMPYTQGHLYPDCSAAFGLFINQELILSDIHCISKSLLMSTTFRLPLGLCSGEHQYANKTCPLKVFNSHELLYLFLWRNVNTFLISYIPVTNEALASKLSVT